VLKNHTPNAGAAMARSFSLSMLADIAASAPPAVLYAAAMDDNDKENDMNAINTDKVVLHTTKRTAVQQFASKDAQEENDEKERAVSSPPKQRTAGDRGRVSSSAKQRRG
jgi:hypothetical protein